jgi:hypothetical protein
MPDAAPPPPRKKESWLGVVFTALLCAIFLWWWFQPAPITADTERSPLYWAGLARKHLGRAEPTLPMRFEIIMIAEAFRERGEQDAAGKLEADWLPPSWTTTGPDGAGGRPADETAPDSPAAPPPELAPLIARFDEAGAALDSLDIERGQDVFRQAADAARKLPEPLRTQALWLVTARQARNSLTAEASTTRQPLAPATAPDDFPDWLADELLEAEIIAPLLASLQGQPADAPPVLRLANQWRSRVRRQAALREPCLISRDGPAADASRPPATDVQALRQAVEANQLGEAARLAKENAGAQLAVARLLIWLAAPTSA